MGNVKIGSIDDIGKKYIDVTPGRSQYYQAGVEHPKADWEAGAAAAVPNLKAAVSAANFGQRVLGGIKKAGTAKWQKKATTLGVSRYGPGVQAAGDDYKAGFAPFQAVISGTTLPERRPRGDPANNQRSAAMGAALTAKRIALLGAGV